MCKDSDDITVHVKCGDLLVKLNKLFVCIFTYLFSLMSQIIYLMTRDVIFSRQVWVTRCSLFPQHFLLTSNI